MYNLRTLLDKLELICNDESEAIEAAETSSDLVEIQIRVFGKEGSLSKAMRKMSELSPEDRPLAGRVCNDVKTTLELSMEASNEIYKQ